MEQIIFFGWLFLALVVSTVDGLNDWLEAQGLTWLLVLGIVVLFGFHAVDKWSIEFAERVKAIEKKLGIVYTPPPVQKKSAWWSLLAMFVIAVYIFREIASEGRFACPYRHHHIVLAVAPMRLRRLCFIDEAVRDYWRKKREWQELTDRLSNKETDC